MGAALIPVILATGWLGMMPGTSLAEGRFDIRQAYTEPVDGVFYLTARIDYVLNDAALEALQSGVALTFEVQIDVTRRRFMNDPTVASLRQRYQLGYHALTGRYLVRNLNSGEQSSFATLSAALHEIGRINQLPILDQALLDPDREYDITLRAVLDVRDIPSALRWLLFWIDDWRLVSDKYKWQLQQ